MTAKKETDPPPARNRQRTRRPFAEAAPMTGLDMELIIIIVLVLLLLGAFPAWPHSRNWGYAPTGGLGLVLLIVLILYLLHYI